MMEEWLEEKFEDGAERSTLFMPFMQITYDHTDNNLKILRGVSNMMKVLESLDSPSGYATK